LRGFVNIGQNVLCVFDFHAEDESQHVLVEVATVQVLKGTFVTEDVFVVQEDGVFGEGGLEVGQILQLSSVFKKFRLKFKE